MGSLRFHHPKISRRTAVQAGALGILGLGANHLAALRAAARTNVSRPNRACIYIFLSGGLSQHDTLDMKPHAPDSIRGEFQPVATATPGIQICEHLPKLAARSNSWALLRSLTHPSNDHTKGHYFMLTGRSTTPPGFRGDRKPRSRDWPSIASVAGDAVRRPDNNLPPAVVLPERLVHWSGGTIPGAYGGIMGADRDPFFIEPARYGDPFWRGAYPEYTFYQLPKQKPTSDRPQAFQAPNLKLLGNINSQRFGGRLQLRDAIDANRRVLESSADALGYDRYREQAISMLASGKVADALDVTRADEKTQRRYGKNSFGWSLLMAFRLVQSGVSLVQVNLGNNEAWDTHGEIFWRLKEKLLPPTDLALSALLDDLSDSGLLDTTLVVVGGEFGRTPKLSTLPEHYDGPGRDHWGATQTLLFAGGGIQGGQVVGASDEIGAYPTDSPQSPENMAATIYNALDIPREAVWHDQVDRPHTIYHGDPIRELIG